MSNKILIVIKQLQNIRFKSHKTITIIINNTIAR